MSTPDVKKRRKSNDREDSVDTAAQALNVADTSADKKSTATTVSVEEAARYCVVSVDTIVKWILENILPANCTGKGTYRVQIDALLKFMTTRGMSTKTLKNEKGCTLMCWQYWAKAGAGWTPDGIAATCVECPVYLSKAELCFEVKPLLPGRTQRSESCVACDFFVASDHFV